MTIGELILQELRFSARRAHRLFASGQHVEARLMAERVDILLSSLRESYTSESAFHQLVRAAIERRLPEAYVADIFIHDRRAIEELQGATEPLRFVWLLHDCGSLLFDANGQHLAGAVLTYSQRYPYCLVFIFEDGVLTHSTPDCAYSFALEHGQMRATAANQLTAAG